MTAVIAMQRKIARVLCDETHSESWSVSAERAVAMQPEDPQNASYAMAAELLGERDFVVDRHLEGAITAEALMRADVLALIHPCDSRWEHTTNAGSPQLSAEEIAAIHEFVRGGGGLLVITEYEHDKYGDNLNLLLAPAGIRIANGRVLDRTACVHENSEWVLAEAVERSPLAHGVEKACFYRASYCEVDGDAHVAWRTRPAAHPAGAPLIVYATLGEGRIVVVTDSNLFGDDRIGEFGHRQLWLNLMYWLAAPAFRQAGMDEVGEVLAEISEPEPWAELKRATDALRLLQARDGSVAGEHHEAARPLGETIAACLQRLAPIYPHQVEYCAAAVADLGRWMKEGFRKPDFGRALAAFNPQQHRRNGIEHIAFFPMYTPNASSDTRFEAVRIGTPWPAWLEELERTRFPNPKFVPGELRDFTAGYASECAVLFPETVSIAERATNNFGIIFCDREAARLQRCAIESARVLGLEVFPELECWLHSVPLLRDTLALWDLIHDASHSLGELPFDPFMIRQRAPFWMYGLEELRVDVRSFGEAHRLAEDGFPFARYVSWAIVLDRILRFPITGNRVRNYDALGGQLLFAWLHQHDVIVWSDNKLRIYWDRLAGGMAGLNEQLRALYKLGATSSKMNFWIAAHDLVAKYVPPNVASKWRADARVEMDEGEPKRWIDLVLDDEFPLGAFHVNLARKLRG